MEKCWCGNGGLDNYSKDYYVCKKCGTLVTKRNVYSTVTAISDEECDLYGSNYWTHTMLEESGEKNLTGLIKQYFGGRVPHWIKYIQRYIPMESSLAEVGCGLGQLSYVLNFMGYYPTVYELSPEICHYLKIQMGLNAICGEFGSINQIYESILNFDLLEHLIDPVSFIKECKKRLYGPSIFCCQTPCYTEEWTYEEMLQNRPDFENLLVPDQHIYIFSKRSITKLLQDNGFPYISFEPAAFGEHYDMFLFASPKPIIVVEPKQLEEEYQDHPNRIIIGQLLDFFDRLNVSK